MRVHAALLSGALLLGMPCNAAAAAGVPPDVQFTVPLEFQGEWNKDVRRCGAGADDSRLRITATTVRFYESGGPIKVVVRRGAREIMFIVELSGEGETWLDAQRLILSADGSSVTAPSDAGPALVRRRCPRK
jgi:hypothetical protein